MKKLDLHYNKMFTSTMSAYSWIQIYRKRGCATSVTMTYNRQEIRDESLWFDYANDFAVHFCDERFNFTHMHIDKFNFEEYGFTKEDIEFFKLALKSQFKNGESKKKPRDVCSKFTLL